MVSSLLVRFRCPWTDQLIAGLAGFWCVFWVFLFVLVGFGFLLFAFLSCTVTAQWIIYRSYSVPFCMHIVVMTDVATALIRWICKMQLSFRLDKRPGESHLALDGKKSGYSRLDENQEYSKSFGSRSCLSSQLNLWSTQCGIIQSIF